MGISKVLDGRAEMAEKTVNGDKSSLVSVVVLLVVRAFLLIERGNGALVRLLDGASADECANWRHGVNPDVP